MAAMHRDTSVPVQFSFQPALFWPSLCAHAPCRTEFNVQEVVNKDEETKAKTNKKQTKGGAEKLREN